jgi:hypothetical protein
LHSVDRYRQSVKSAKAALKSDLVVHDRPSFGGKPCRASANFQERSVKLTLTSDIVSNMTLDVHPFSGRKISDWPALTKAASADAKATAKAERKEWAPKANYLVYDQHRDAPVGFGIRVGKEASIFLVEKMVARRGRVAL